jgi:hypothetical protein
MALSQLWLFWVAPIIGGVVGSALYAGIFEARTHHPRNSWQENGSRALVRLNDFPLLSVELAK